MLRASLDVRKRHLFVPLSERWNKIWLARYRVQGSKIKGMLLVDCSLETEKKRRYFEKRRSQVYALRRCMYYRDTNFTVESSRKRTPKGTSASVPLSGGLCY